MTLLDNNLLSLILWSGLLRPPPCLSSINQTSYLATSRPRSPFGSLAAQTQMQCQSLIRVYHRFHRLLFPHTMYLTPALHLMGSLLSSRISIYRYIAAASCSRELSILKATQITSALPRGTNIYGLGEVVGSSGFRRDIGTDGGSGTIQTHWNRDDADPIDQNMYVPGCTPKEDSWFA